jgi:hypothetical protein
MSFADSIRQTASIALCAWEAVTTSNHTTCHRRCKPGSGVDP